MYLLSGDSGHILSHSPQNLPLGSSAVSSHHTSWSQCALLGISPSLPSSPTSPLPPCLFHWCSSLLGAKCLGSTSAGRQRPAVGKTCNHGPCQDWEGLPWL